MWVREDLFQVYAFYGALLVLKVLALPPLIGFRRLTKKVAKKLSLSFWF